MQGRKRSWIIVYRLRTAGVKPRFIVITIAIRVRHARAASLGKKYSWTCVASFPRTWENMCRSRFASLELQFSSGRGGSRILERGGTRTEATLSVMCVCVGGGHGSPWTLSAQYKLPSLSSKHSYFKILYTFKFLNGHFYCPSGYFTFHQILGCSIGNNYFYLLDIALVSTPAQLKESSIIATPYC